MPGSGENPVLYSHPEAERTYLTWLDHLPQRTDVDGKRIAVWGGSFGGYWAARLAYVAPDRLKGAVFHGGSVHYGFQKEWLIPAFTTGGATYLFGAHSLLEARSRAMGTNTLDEFLEIAPRFSLVIMGLIDKPRPSASTASSTIRPGRRHYLLMGTAAQKRRAFMPTVTWDGRASHGANY